VTFNNDNNGKPLYSLSQLLRNGILGYWLPDDEKVTSRDLVRVVKEQVPS
jgi:hypothetical protein